MSTSFGEFKDENGNEYYFTTSQGSGRTYLCQGDDTRVILSLSLEETKQMYGLLELAIIHVEGVE